MEAAVYAGPLKSQKMTAADLTQTSSATDTLGAAVEAPTPVAVPVGAVPRVEVVAQRTNDRPDDATTYYVVIDPIDPTVDAFKSAVKHVLLALAANNGGPVFSAYVWDHLPGAQTEVSYRSHPELFSEDMFRAKSALNNQHLVANYSGGLTSFDGPSSYVLFWFPEAGLWNADRSRWVSAEPWRP